LTDEVVSVDKHQGGVEYRHLTSRFYRAHLQEAPAQQIDPSRIHLSKLFSSVKFDDVHQELVITLED
jgi:salicylate hydroxylase